MPSDFLGLVAAPFTPMAPDGGIRLEVIDRQAERLAADGVVGAFICGTSGEYASLTVEERRQVARRWRDAAGKDFRLFVHVGSLCLADSQELARHARSIAADAIAALAPCYFRPAGVDDLAAYCAEMVRPAGGLPFYYYHIPSMTGVYLCMADFLSAAGAVVAGLAGMKFTHEDLMDFARCAALQDGRYRMLFGRDEMLLAGLALGATGAVGTTYNFAAPLHRRIVRAFQAGDLPGARADQVRSAEMVALLRQFGGLPAMKAVMKMLGLDCGPVRPPLRNPSDEQYRQLQAELDRLGFFSPLFRNA